jgi:hypothetical protein
MFDLVYQGSEFFQTKVFKKKVEFEKVMSSIQSNRPIAIIYNALVITIKVLIIAWSELLSNSS